MLEMSDESENSPFLEATQHSFIISDSVALKVYSNINPQNMKIASLQKAWLFYVMEMRLSGKAQGLESRLLSILMK